VQSRISVTRRDRKTILRKVAKIAKTAKERKISIMLQKTSDPAGVVKIRNVVRRVANGSLFLTDGLAIRPTFPPAE